MKRFFGLVIILSSLSIPAFAAKNSQNFTFANTVKVGATQLPAGDYKVTWTGTDANVQVAIVKNGKTIVTVPAKLEPAKNDASSLGTRTVGGVNVLETIQLDKMNLVLKSATANGE